jgi:hypothetical protein
MLKHGLCEIETALGAIADIDRHAKRGKANSERQRFAGGLGVLFNRKTPAFICRDHVARGIGALAH